MQEEPQPFRRLVAAFYQGSDAEYANAEGWVDSRLRTLTSEERATVKDYLDHALGDGFDQADLQAAWDDGNSCFFIRGDALMAFLTFVRERIGVLARGPG